jgi:hypothetical protein
MPLFQIVQISCAYTQKHPITPLTGILIRVGKEQVGACLNGGNKLIYLILVLRKEVLPIYGYTI